MVRGALGLVLGAWCLVLGACASAPPPTPPVITWEQKLDWMMRLEDQRILRDPNPPAPVILRAATGRSPAIVAPPPPSDLVRLMRDTEARVRRRSALAAGRVGLPEAVQPLSDLLAKDEDPEVRQMAAFALGLIGDPAARPALQAALAETSPLVQGRAAEALGLIGDKTDAAAVSAMVQTHVKSGALATITPDDLSYPLAPGVEAARLGMYALVRLGDYPALAAAALDAGGQVVSRWWPVAYALQRLGDNRAAPVLVSLLSSEGRFTPAFAARGLGTMKAAVATAPLVRIVTERRAHEAVVVQAIRALAAIGDRRAAAALTAIVTDAKAPTLLRLEAVTALASVHGDRTTDLMFDLLSDSWPPIRGAAARTLATIDPDSFIVALSGLDPDRDWTVRAAQAAALGTLPPDRGQPRLMTMLRDADQRVIAAALNALAAMKAPGADKVFVQHLTAEDFVVRAAAAKGLGELKASSAVQPLTAAYRTAQKDNTYVARAAVLDALAKLDPAAVRPLLQEAQADRDWAVRVRAAAILGELKSPATPDALRPAPSERLLREEERKWAVAPPYSPHAYIETERGTIEIELAVLDAPTTVATFMDLARRGFFNGVAIHRVVADFVVQDGDARGDGEGGPGYTIRDELNQRPYLRGTVGMALDWKDTGGSQFFITHSPQPHLDARYTVFGQVVNGMDVVDRIQPRDTIKRIRIWDGVTP